MSTWQDRMAKLDNPTNQRDEYGRDRARIIHSAFFRRLQGKTQVLGLGESDFYRTRLTHSIEVAQISSGISETLRKSSELDLTIKNLLPSIHLIEAIALAHDIGHPPFGHGGEVALNYCMRDHGGFEGNAQTLRICSKLGEFSSENGLNLTRRTLLGVIKYPAKQSATRNNLCEDSSKAPINIDSYKPSKCFYDCDHETYQFATEPFSDEAELFSSLSPGSTIEGQQKHNRTIYKALDTTIMELADDIAYGIHDLEDAIALNLVTARDWQEQVCADTSLPAESWPALGKVEITNLLFAGGGKERKRAISSLVNHMINSCTLEKNEDFRSDMLCNTAKIQPQSRLLLDKLQKFTLENVIRTPEVQTLEYKGQQMIVRLFEAIANNPSRLLPKKFFEEYSSAHQEKYRLRVVCDYLAGTTDDYATKIYHKIFTPSSGSIFDKL